MVVVLIKSTALSRYLATQFPVYVVCGEELLLVQETLKSIHETLRGFGFTRRKIFYVGNNFDWSVVVAHQTGSLFDSGQLLEIRITVKPNKEAIDAIKCIVSMCLEGREDLYLLIFPALDQATFSSSWFKLLEKVGLVVQVENIARYQLAQWIRDRLAHQNQTIVNNDAGIRALNFIIEHVEGNLLAAHQEILKLGLIYPEGELTDEQVVAAITNVARFDILKLRDTLFDDDLKRSIKILYYLRDEGASPALVLWAIVEELRCLGKILHFVTRGGLFDVAASQYRIWGARLIAYRKIVKRVSLDQISSAIYFAFLVDCQIKGVLSLSERAVFRMPIILGNDAWDSFSNLLQYLSR